MNLILLGAPGAGKGTQGELISKELGIPTISTGNMLREAMANGTELGQKIKKFMDGVPRTLVQAEVLDAKGVRIDHVVSLEVKDEEIVGRMSGRRVCTACGASYHIVSNPPKTEGVCDNCGGEVTTRKDDEPATVLHRLEVYHASTEVLKSYYQKQGKLRVVKGNQPIENTHRDILKAIGAKV